MAKGFGAEKTKKPNRNQKVQPPSFLGEVLWATAQSNGNFKVVYPLLQANLHKLNENFLQEFCNWADTTLPKAEPKAVRGITLGIINFSTLLWQFPWGNRAINLEIALTGYEVATNIFSRDAFPEEWAQIQSNLAPAYRHRIKGDRADNLEKGIAACQQALQVFTHKAFPEKWATIQNNIGLLYGDRIKGDRAENLEKAIACYDAGLQVHTRKAFPTEWATLQNNLGIAYSYQIYVREPDQNLEKAIDCYKAALEVRTKEASPYYWASSQFSLGNAYCVTIRGNRAENLENAIACYEDALQVYTRDAYPERWANAQTSLGGAYMLRVKGDQAKNLDKAIACYEAALEVYTEVFPRQASQVQEELEDAYRQRKELYQDGETPDFLHQVLQAIRKNLYSQAFRFRTANLDKLTDQLKNDKSARLSNLIEHSPHNSLDQIMQVIGRAVHPILEANLDKLTEDNFATRFRRWAITKLSEVQRKEVTGKEEADILSGISGFCGVIQQFPLGNRANNLEMAIAGYEAITTVFTRETFPELWAETQLNLSNAYCNRIKGERADNLERSILCCQEALSIVNGDKFPSYWAMLQANLATAYSKRIKGSVADNLEIAVRCNELALQVHTREVFPEEWAKLQNNLGIVYGDRIKGDRAENLEKAIACYEQALQIYTKDEFPEEWAKTQQNMGFAYSHRIKGDQSENLEMAIQASQAAFQVFTREAFPEYWAQCHINLGEAFRERIKGNPAQNLELAIEAYQTALQVGTFEAFPELWASAHNNLGIAYYNRIRGNREENLEKAVQVLQAALQVRTLEAFPREWARLQHNLALAYSERIKGNRGDNLEKAITACQAASQVFTRDAFPYDWAKNQNNLAIVYTNRGQIDEAVACCRSALEVFTPTAFPSECFITARQFGEIGARAKRWAESIEGYGVAIEAVETSRAWATSESRRQEIVTEAFYVYHNIVLCCINAGQLEKAIEYVERSRSKRLVDLMASNDLYQGGEIPPEVKELLHQFDDLQQQIDQERSQNQSGNNRELIGVGTNTRDRAAFQAYNEAITTLEAEKQQIWEQLRRFDPVLAGEIQVSAPDFCAMQQLIDRPTTAILSFYTTSNDTHVFVLRQNQITCHTCTGQGIETLQFWISQNWLKPYIEDRNIWKSHISDFLVELAQRLLLSDLIVQHLDGITELIIVPHLLLHQIPFTALPIQDPQHSYLGEKFLIRYTPSCQVLEFCQQRGEVGEYLTYGAVEDATNDLPCARFEGEQIAQLHQIPNHRRLRGSSQATRDNYRQLAEKVQVLHSCHHAESCLDHPLDSKLKLGDGSITLGQLMTPSWRLPNLSDVFLSCCETGLGLPEITDDILTLSTGFLCAGARSVVSTLWAVNDLATALFSIFYYQHRQQGKSRPEALRQAQIKLRQLKRDDLADLAKQAEARQKEAIRERKQYQQGSVERLKWEHEYRMYDGVTRQINLFKNFQNEFPFSDPCYWAAFTCQGLR